LQVWWEFAIATTFALPVKSIRAARAFPPDHGFTTLNTEFPSATAMAFHQYGIASRVNTLAFTVVGRQQ